METRDWWKIAFENAAWIEVDFRVRGDNRIAADVEGIIGLTQLTTGSYILDIACGVGRHCSLFAECGYYVVGVDYSLFVLQEARKRVANPPVNVEFIRADMRSLPFASNMFHCTINIYNSWGYFESDDENMAVLLEAYRCLRPGGRLVLQYTNMWWKPNREQSRRLEIQKDFRYTRETRFDEETGLWFGAEVYEWLDRAEIRRDVWKMKIYRPAELDNFLHQAGFALIEWYGDWRGRPLCEDSPHIIAVATKS
jgi:SAM-dependent methyltransferase